MPSKKKPRKGYKHSGSYNQFPFSEKNFDELSKILEEPISDKAKAQLQEAGGNYYLYHHAFDNRVTIPEIKAACNLIIRQGGAFAQTLINLDDTTLDKISMQQKTDILDTHERLQNDLEIFINATETWLKNREKFETEHPRPKQGRHKERSALEISTKELIPIFEEITGEKATSTYNECRSVYDPTTIVAVDKGLFVTFTRYCIDAIQNETISDYVIVTAIRKALRTD